MKLYHTPGACSLSAHIALREAGLAFEPVRVPTKTHQLPDGTDYYSINPLGYVPLLELDDGTRLREVPVILQYIADLVPTSNLAPAPGTLQRYRLQEWLAFTSSELHKSYSPLFNPNLPEETRKFFRDKLVARYRWVDGELAGREFLLAEHFTVADAYLFVVTRWAPSANIDLAGLSTVQAHHERIRTRPAVQEAMRAEGLIK